MNVDCPLLLDSSSTVLLLLSSSIILLSLKAKNTTTINITNIYNTKPHLQTAF